MEVPGALQEICLWRPPGFFGRFLLSSCGEGAAELSGHVREPVQLRHQGAGLDHKSALALAGLQANIPVKGGEIDFYKWDLH